MTDGISGKASEGTRKLYLVAAWKKHYSTKLHWSCGTGDNSVRHLPGLSLPFLREWDGLLMRYGYVCMESIRQQM